MSRGGRFGRAQAFDNEIASTTAALSIFADLGEQVIGR